MTLATYRSPHVDRMLAEYRPASDTAPYVADGPRAERMVRKLHAAPRRFNLGGLIAGLVLGGFAVLGLLAITFGAVSLMLMALSCVGRAA